jgi:hypothetical protein
VDKKMVEVTCKAFLKAYLHSLHYPNILPPTQAWQFAKQEFKSEFINDKGLHCNINNIPVPGAPMSAKMNW